MKDTLARLVRDPTDSTLVQLLRYTFVGGVAFVCDFGALYALTEFAGLHYLISASLSFLLGLGVNYALSVLWVFSRRLSRAAGWSSGSSRRWVSWAWL